MRRADWMYLYQRILSVGATGRSPLNQFGRRKESDGRLCVP